MRRANDPHRRHQAFAIAAGAQEVEADRRLLPEIRIVQVDAASAIGPQLMHGDGDAGFLGHLSLGIREERVHHEKRIRHRKPLVGAEIGAYRSRRHRQQSCAGSEIGQALPDAAKSSRAFIVSHATPSDMIFEPGRVVILEILADPGQIVADLDAKRLEPFRLADAGQFKKLRGGNRSR
jgi:hypothetical protein